MLEVTYMSFMKQVDYAASYMASDYYYILASVLEKPPTTEIPFDKLQEHRIQCFWDAYDTFDGGLQRLNSKIDDCKHMFSVLMT